MCPVADRRNVRAHARQIVSNGPRSSEPAWRASGVAADLTEEVKTLTGAVNADHARDAQLSRSTRARTARV